MSETTQTYLGLESTSRQTNPGFQSVLNYIRERATSEYRKGDLFERLMLTYFSEDPDYQQQFSEVYLYKDWAALQTDYDANDIGIDLVAKEHDGGYCAIQCKCYAENTRISKPHLDSFISASTASNPSHCPYFGKKNPNIFYLANGQCDSPISKSEQPSSMNRSVYPASQKKHIGMSSTAEPRSNGSSTVTKSRRTKTAASSTTPTAGSTLPATSSRQ